MQTQATHTPDYIVIGQMLDNPEKAPLRDQDLTENHVHPANSATSNILLSPQTPHTPSSEAFFQPPEYTSPTSPIPPSESEITSNPSSTGVGLATKVTIERITIPTKNKTLSSGFPYEPRVYDLISNDEWHDLSSDIVNAAKITFGEDWGAWTTGITAGTLSTVFIIFLGPVAGYFAGRAVHRKNVVKVAKERLERDGDIRSVLRRWNEQTFQRRGFQVWLELPIDGAELEEPKVKTKPTDSNEAKALRAERKVQRKIARRFKIVIIPNSGGSQPLLGQDVFCESPSEREETLVVEAMGNELRDPVELKSTRDPAELQDNTSSAESEKTTTERPLLKTKGKEAVATLSIAGRLDGNSSSTQAQSMAPVELDASPVSQSTPSTPNLAPS